MNSSTVSNFHIPRWAELPNLDLYLDQTVTLLDKILKNFICNKEEPIITKTMINNYVKQGVMKPPKKKKYNKIHIVTLIVVCILKQVYNINDIQELMKLAVHTTKFNLAYDAFCEAIENSISYTFDGVKYDMSKDNSYEQLLLNSAAQSFASKLYVEKTFLHK